MISLSPSLFLSVIPFSIWMSFPPLPGFETCGVWTKSCFYYTIVKAKMWKSSCKLKIIKCIQYKKLSKNWKHTTVFKWPLRSSNKWWEVGWNSHWLSKWDLLGAEHESQWKLNWRQWYGWAKKEYLDSFNANSCCCSLVITRGCKPHEEEWRAACWDGWTSQKA